MPVITDPKSDRRGGASTRKLLLACLPAVAIGVMIRVWLMRTSLLQPTPTGAVAKSKTA